MAALGVPLVHALGFVVEVEDFRGCDGVATNRMLLVVERGNKVIAVARLIVINRELGVNQQ